MSFQKTKMELSDDLSDLVSNTAIWIISGISLPHISGNCDDTEKQKIRDFIKKISPQLNKEYSIEEFGVFSAVKNTVVEQYIKSGLENARKQIKQKEPLRVQHTDKQSINEKNIKGEGTVSDLALYNVSAFEVKKVKSNVDKSSVDFALNFPSMKATCKYSMEGTVEGQNVKGNGNLEIHLKNFYTSVSLQISEKDNVGVQVETLVIDYDFNDLKLTATGLKISNMKESEVDNVLNDSLKKYFKANRKQISSKVAAEIKTQLNAKLKGHSSKEVMKMLSDGGIFMMFLNTNV